MWTVVQGEGSFVFDGKKRSVKPDDVLVIPVGHYHAIKAGNEPLTFIEVQVGSPLIEEDIERFEFEWYILPKQIEPESVRSCESDRGREESGWGLSGRKIGF